MFKREEEVYAFKSKIGFVLVELIELAVFESCLRHSRG